MKYYLVSAITVSFLLSGCGTRSTPAPIVKIGNAMHVYDYSDKGKLKSSNYKVKPGETLYAIAWQAGIDFRYLARLNNISEPYQIFPGQEISLQASKDKGLDNDSKKQVVKIQTLNEKKYKKTVPNKKKGG